MAMMPILPMMFRRVTIVLLCLSGSPLDVFAETQRDSPRSYVFTDAEIAQCTRMRTPNLVHNPKTGSIHMAVRCCGKNRCANALTGEADRGVLRDNLKDCKVGLKTSKDGGRTWGGWQIVSGASPGYGHGSPLWDVKRERIVLQYQSFLSAGGATKPTSNTSMRSRMSFISTCIRHLFLRVPHVLVHEHVLAHAPTHSCPRLLPDRL